MKRTRAARLVAVVVTALIVGASPSVVVALGDLDRPSVCAGPVLGGPPPDSQRVTWEYSPPSDSSPAHLVCATDQLAALIDAAHGDWGVAVRDLRSHETLLANADRHFVAGSLYKLGVAAEAYARMEAGTLAQDSLVVLNEQDVDPEYGGSMYDAGTYLSVRQAVQAMLTQSDNGAALALVDRLGLNAVNTRFLLLGMPETRLVYDAVTTPRDMLSYFTLLADGDVVSVEASDSLVAVLRAQEINDRIPAGLPPGEGWWVAHKTANVDDMLGDAGIVYTAHDAAYALIVITQGDSSYWDGVQTIRAISQSVYRAVVPLEDSPSP